MALIKTIAEVKAVLRISSLDDFSSIPDIEEAEQKYIIPQIGQALYDEIHTAYNANSMTARQISLVRMIQKPLAAYAYHDSLALQHAMITDAGVRRTTTDNMPAAYRWEYEGVKEALADKAATGMEALLTFLDQYKADFTAWTSSSQYARRLKMLFKNAVQFCEIIKLHQPYRTFEALIPIMEDVERMYISPTIGEAFYRELIAKANPQMEEIELLYLLKKTMANYAITHGHEKLVVQVTFQGITTYDKSPDSSNQRAQPAAEMVSFSMRSAQRDAETYLAKAKKMLNTMASATIFPTYFTSPYYEKPVQAEDPNKRRKFYTFIR